MQLVRPSPSPVVSVRVCYCCNYIDAGLIMSGVSTHQVLLWHCRPLVLRKSGPRDKDAEHACRCNARGNVAAVNGCCLEEQIIRGLHRLCACRLHIGTPMATAS